MSGGEGARETRPVAREVKRDGGCDNGGGGSFWYGCGVEGGRPSVAVLCRRKVALQLGSVN